MKISRIHHRTRTGIIKKNPIRNTTKMGRIALDIEKWLIKNEATDFLRIYFDGKAWEYKNGKRVVLNGMKGSNFTEYANDKTITMTFEGTMYSFMNGEYGWKHQEEFLKLLKKHGYYFEMGNAWNLVLCEI